MNKEYSREQINSMIQFIREKDIAEIVYISPRYLWFDKNYNGDLIDSGDYILFDHKTCSHLTEQMIISLAIENNWEAV